MLIRPGVGPLVSIFGINLSKSAFLHETARSFLYNMN